MMCKGGFNCSGKVNINDWTLNEFSLIKQREIDILLDCESDEQEHCYQVFGCNVAGCSTLLQLSHFTKCVDMRLKQLITHEEHPIFGVNSNVNIDKDFFLLRKEVCEFMVHLRNYIKCIHKKHFTTTDVCTESGENFNELVKTIYKFLNRLEHIKDTTLRYVTSSQGNLSKEPQYHMYHMHIDLRWLIITLLNVRYNSWQNFENSHLETVENTILNVVKDLIFISGKLFNMVPLLDLRTQTPYICTCIRELWLMLQILTDLVITENSKKFWDYVNDILDKVLLSNNSNDLEMNGVTSNFNIVIKNPELFSLWIIYHLNLLYSYNVDGTYCDGSFHRIKSNVKQVEKILKIYVEKGGKTGLRDEIDDELSVIIPILKLMCIDYWEPHSPIIIYLWECFSKRLDKTFQKQTGLCTIAYEKKSPKEILKQVKERNEMLKLDRGQSSYEMFLRLLGASLQKNQKDRKFWLRLQSSFYTKFSENKVQEYSEVGIYNFISLFLTLAYNISSSNISSVSTKMISLLKGSMDFNDKNVDKKCLLAWKSELALLLLYNEKKLSYQELAGSYLQVVNLICEQKDSGFKLMMTSFFDILEIILTECSDYSCHQYLFVDRWIDHYLKHSSANIASNVIKTFLKVFEKCNNVTDSSGFDLMLDSLWRHLAPRFRILDFSEYSDNSYQDAAKLAAMFTLDSIKNPDVQQKYGHSSFSLFQHFAASPIICDVRISRLYLVLILQSNHAAAIRTNPRLDFDMICIQSWIKFSILVYDNNSYDSRFLLKYILQVKDLKEILSTREDVDTILSSDKPFLRFLEAISKARLKLKDNEIKAFDNKWRKYFQGMDKWIVKLITENNKNSKLSLWIYHCIGAVFSFCSPILYCQKPNLFKILLMTIAFQAGANHLMQLLGEIFDLIVKGFENINTLKNDLTLQTLFRDLFDKYLPLLITENSNKTINSFTVNDKLLKCFENFEEKFVRYIFETLANNFIIVPRDNKTHSNCYLVMLLLKKLLRERSSKCILKLIISTCISPIVNCYMKVNSLHPHKTQTISFFADLIGNTNFTEDLLVNVRDKILHCYNDQNMCSLVKGIFELNNQDYVQFNHESILHSDMPKNYTARNLLQEIRKFILNRKKKG